MSEGKDLLSERDANHLLELFIDHTPAALAMLDREMRYLHASRRWRADFGLGDRDLRGVSHYELFPEIGEAWKRVHQRALLGEVVSAEADPFHRADGSLQWLRWEVRPWFEDSGGIGGIIISSEDITRQHEAEERLRQRAHEDALQEQARQNEHRYRQLLDAAPDAMIVVGEDGKIELVNLQTERLFGYAREELVGQPLDILIPERMRDAHRLHVGRFFKQPTARPMRSGIELFGRLKDGREIPIEVSLAPLQTEHGLTVSAAVRDISERRRLENATAVLAQRLTSAVEAMDGAFVLFDAQDRVVLCNTTYRNLLADWVDESLIGKSFEELLETLSHHVELPDKDEATRIRFRDERIARRRVDPTAMAYLRMRDGRSLRVINRRTPEGGVVTTVWDLTEDERRAEELRRAQLAAEAGSAAKTEFLASMSHELRTPLNAILGFAQLLQRDKKQPVTPTQRERLGHILSGGEHLLRLIDDVLDLSRIDVGAVSVSIEPVKLSDVLHEMNLSLEPLEERYGITVVVDPLPPHLAAVAADRTRLIQILANLCSNALKYNRPAPEGTVRVTVSPSPTKGRIRVTVRDTGYGIPAAKQALLFQPFQRAGQETGPIEGTGIGLVITRRLAAMMKGEVGFESVPNEGSSFWVDLPEHNGASPSLAKTEASPVPSSRHGARRVVLYVEDNPANVTFMRDLIESLEGVELLVASTAEVGIDLAREHHPSAIIMDINLPGMMNGFDALRVLHAADDTKSIPVIALSAAAQDVDRRRGLHAGFTHYMTKPVKVDELVTVLEALLEDAPKVGGAAQEAALMAPRTDT